MTNKKEESSFYCLKSKHKGSTLWHKDVYQARVQLRAKVHILMAKGTSLVYTIYIIG